MKEHKFKLCIVLIAIFLLQVFLPVVGGMNIWFKVYAAVTSDNKFEYTVLADNTVEITKYKGNDTEVSIPSMIDGKTVTRIGEKAFYECSSLTNIEIPSSVTSIGYCAFYGCRSLINIEIPSSITSIGDGAFYGCRSLTNIEIPSGVTRIENSAFNDCRSLTNIEIPSGVIRINTHAFSGCSSLINIKIPSSVTRIERSVFEGCSNLTSIDIDINNKSYSSENGVLFNKDKTVIISYLSAKKDSNYTIPSSVTSIGDYAFEECSSLTDIEIPSSVTSIGDYAFYGCSSLTNIEIPSNVTSIGDHAFYGCGNLTNIDIPSSVTNIEDGAFDGCSSLISIDVDKNNKSYISENGVLFNKDKTVIIVYPSAKKGNNYTIPSRVTSIGNYAFGGCRSLTNIEIPSSVTSIGHRAFDGCGSLTNIGIPSSVTSIGYGAFDGCRSLTNIEISSSVTSIGGEAFNMCYKLKIYTNSDYVVSYAQKNSIEYVLDKDPPTITGVTLNPDTWTRDNTIVTINGASDAIIGLASEPYSFDNGTTWQEENIKTYTENTQGIQIQVKDKFGNVYQHEPIDTKIDREAPMLEVTGNATNWTKDNVTLRIKASDALSGIKEVMVNETKVELTNGQGNYTVSGNGTYTIIAKDNASNTTTKEIVVDKIDKKIPTLEVIGNATNWTKENVTLRIQATDSLSGLKEVTVNGTKVELTNGQANYTVSANGTYTVIAKDNASNTTTKEVVVDKIDKEVPTLEVTGNATNWTKENVTLRIQATDSLSGLKEVTVNETKVELMNGEGTYIVNANGTYTIIAKDNADNVTTKKIVVDNIDKEAPVWNVTYSETETTNKDVTVTITSNEELQEVESWMLSKDKKTLTKTYARNTTEDVTIYDLAGNRSVVKIAISNIDKIAPAVEVKYSTTLTTNHNVIVELIADKQVKEVEGWILSSDGLKLTKEYEQNTEEEVTISDTKGNTETVKVTINNIDKEAPVATVTYDTSTKGEVTVVITAKEEIQEIEGWTLSSNKLKLTKRYTKDTKEEIEIMDKIGNRATIKIDVKIPKESEEPKKDTNTNGSVVTTTVTQNSKINQDRTTATKVIPKAGNLYQIILIIAINLITIFGFVAYKKYQKLK